MLCQEGQSLDAYFINNEVDEFHVCDCNFYETSDLFKTRFEIFNLEKCFFSKFVGFENCVFGKNDSKEAKYIALFKYVTFQSFVNLRNATFLSGLDFDLVNLSSSASLNALNADIPIANTERETFRIIKDSFQKIGNNIEANKYFVKEMKKYKEELSNTKKWYSQDRVIFFWNEKISNFGQSYLRPIAIFFIFALLYKWVIAGYNNETLYKIYPPLNGAISNTADFLNSMIRNIPHFSKVLKSGMESVSLVFYLIFVVLIWQTVVAVKRHVRR